MDFSPIGYINDAEDCTTHVSVFGTLNSHQWETLFKIDERGPKSVETAFSPMRNWRQSLIKMLSLAIIGPRSSITKNVFNLRLNRHDLSWRKNYEFNGKLRLYGHSPDS